MNTVAIVGRPNVGKSTLFNRMTGSRKAIVDDVSGVTRDRIYGEVEWNGLTFNIIDTGGYVKHTDDIFEKEIKKQVQLAIDEAQVILFMQDVTTGITDLDDEVADLLRRSKKKVIVVVNKVDNYERELAASEFYKLGFEDVFTISSLSGTGSGELLTCITEKLDKDLPWDNKIAHLPKFTLLGRPNVGKSSLLNSLLGLDRTIVSDVAGTTRDSIHTHYNLYGKECILIDTAGIRKKKNVHEDLEYYSVIRSIKSIDEADVCIMMVDAVSGLESQDLQIISQIERKKKGLVILVNKWDLLPKETNTLKDMEEVVRKKIAPFTDVPILFISATEKIRIGKIIDVCMQVFENKNRKITTSKLNEVIQEAVAATQPPAHRGHLIKVKYATQLPAQIPTFALFCNHPKEIKEPYRNYLEKKLRNAFQFTGTQINLFFREK
jgi:GTP-binding protein